MSFFKNFSSFRDSTYTDADQMPGDTGDIDNGKLAMNSETVNDSK